MRIAVVANTAWYLHNFRLTLMRALAESGHEVIAIAPEDGKHDKRITEAGFVFAPIRLSGEGVDPFTELRSVLGLHRTLRAHGSQLILSYTPKGNLYSALAGIMMRVPFVPNVSGLGRAFIRRSAVTVVAWLLYRVTLRRAARIFFQNNDDLELFVKRRLAPRDRCERLPGSGVDLGRFAPTPLPERAPEAPAFLLVARLLWDKGVGEFIEAARTVRARYPAASFRLLGFVDVANPSAISRQQIDLWVREGLVEYLGVADDVRPFLLDADCVVLPSYREGVPRSLLEAAACARPVITTDAPGCRDTVDDGRTGLLCRPADAADLARQMVRFIELSPKERTEMGLQGRAKMEREFDERLVIAAYERVVSDLVRSRSI